MMFAKRFMFLNHFKHIECIKSRKPVNWKGQQYVRIPHTTSSQVFDVSLNLKTHEMHNISM